MNVTAFIDVLFLLVLFLLVTAKYDTEGGIAVDLPQGKTQESPQVPDTFDITVMHDGTMFLDKTAVAESELGLEIQKMRGHLKDPVLVIRTDREAPAGKIIRITEIAKAVGQRKLNFRTKQ